MLELKDKQSSAVRNNVIKEFILQENVSNEELGKLQGIIGGVAEDEDCLLCETTDYYKNCIMAIRVW